LKRYKTRVKLVGMPRYKIKGEGRDTYHGDDYNLLCKLCGFDLGQHGLLGECVIWSDGSTQEYGDTEVRGTFFG